MALNSERGYTLAEAMLTVAIVAILAAVAAPLLVHMTNFWRQTTARNEIERDVRTSLDTFNRFARQAKGGTIVISRNSSQPPDSKITFTNIQGQALTFYQDGNKLYLSVNGNISLLSSNIAYVAFTYPQTSDTSLISVAITTQSKTYLGGRKALQLSIQKVRVMN